MVCGITDIDVCTTFKRTIIGLVITDKFACIVISTEGVERHRLIPQIRAADSLWDIGIARKFSSYQFGGGCGVLDGNAFVLVNDIISIVVLKWCQGEVALVIASSTVLVITRFFTATVDISMTIRIHSCFCGCSAIGNDDTIGSFCFTRKKAESPNLGILGRRNIFSQTDVTIVASLTQIEICQFTIGANRVATFCLDGNLIGVNDVESPTVFSRSRKRVIASKRCIRVVIVVSLL